MNGSSLVTENEAGPSRSHSHHQIRRSSHSNTHTRSQSQSSSTSQRRQSYSSYSSRVQPESTIEDEEGNSNSNSRKGKSHHLDIATYPTQQLLRLLAGLLQHIATSNDALRVDLDPDLDESNTAIGDGQTETLKEESSPLNRNASSRSRSHSRTSSSLSQNHISSSSSPTTALFDQSEQSSSSSSSNVAENLTSHEAGSSISNDEFPLFTASKSSLSHPSSLLAFHARHIPSISIEAYLLRILKYCPTTNEVFLGLLVYFDRMTRLGTPQGVGGTQAIFGGGGKDGKGKSFAIDSYNVHRLVIAGVTVASKFFSDVFYTNSRYAKVGGLPPTELNSLELQFLLLNDFRLRISLEEMQKYGDRLLAYAEEQEEKSKLETERERERMEKSQIEDGDGMNANGSSEQSQSVASASTDTTRPSDEPHPTTPQTNIKTSSMKPSTSNPPPSQENGSDVKIGTAGSNGVTPSQSAINSTTSGPSGIRDWVRNEEVLTSRMASPIRD
ncbi:uncharacterized protein I206_102766 [Kwoniella pini CBS 10737]|uniref:Glycogen storage control protein n=1 Tax=Kwoniella pini CBS 10737 TaxID=1296096 RepID=A0A1B9I6A4_9TREE|nr:uncharacterized protein I206_03121 [Kwoniella pini CBS 10737]OCF51056.1 hypothetical protein I206_03121 [Kwoniella pini CBS 10737]